MKFYEKGLGRCASLCSWLKRIEETSCARTSKEVRANSISTAIRWKARRHWRPRGGCNRACLLGHSGQVQAGTERVPKLIDAVDDDLMHALKHEGEGATEDDVENYKEIREGIEEAGGTRDNPNCEVNPLIVTWTSRDVPEHHLDQSVTTDGERERRYLRVV